jgi:hypothetical protein
MTTKPNSRAWWYRLIVGLLAAFSWCVAVAAFAGRFSAMRGGSGQANVLTFAGWGLGLCAFLLLADLLGSAHPTDLHPDV